MAHSPAFALQVATAVPFTDTMKSPIVQNNLAGDRLMMPRVHLQVVGMVTVEPISSTARQCEIGNSAAGNSASFDHKGVPMVTPLPIRERPVISILRVLLLRTNKELAS